MPVAEPIVLIAEFTALQDQNHVVADLLAGLAAQVRREPGNIAFDCYRRADDRHRFVVYEIYRDQQAFDAHIAADYGAVFNTRLQQLIVEPHSMLTFLKPLQAASS
jgi:quinol monooxygenase YgiN